jgi:phenylacetate-CoA oxygenase PaaJ subunit
MVTESEVWDALAEIPDPEIPVISLVELGVVRNVAVEDGHVRVDFTPTFLGCPALEVMRDAMAERIRALGAEPEINVCLDDSWSTDRITPSGREKLRLNRNAPREHLRPDAVPVVALLHELQAAVRAVQNDLMELARRRRFQVSGQRPIVQPMRRRHHLLAISACVGLRAFGYV